MSLLRPFTRFFRLFSLHLRVRRNGPYYHLVLARREPAAAPAAPPPPEPVGMQAELHRLLARHERARHLMRHLGYVERLMRLRGVDEAMNEVPLDVLQKAFDQFQGLAPQRLSPGLTELRQRFMRSIAGKEQAARHFEPTDSALSVFDSPQRLQVCEASASDFEAVEKNWGARPQK